MSPALKLLLRGRPLARAAAWWQAGSYDTTADALTQTAPGGVAAARFGSGVGSDSGDPKLLPVGAANVYLPGGASNYISTPDSAAVSITGSIDFRGHYSLTTPAAAQSLCAKFTSTSSNRSFRINITAGAAVYVGNSNNGSAEQVTASIAPPIAFAADVPFWIRVTYDVATGAVQVFVRPDASTMPTDWGVPGTSAAAATGTIFDGIAPLTLGATDAGGAAQMVGKCFYAELRSGIDGAVVARFDAALCGQTGYTDAINATPWTVNRAATGRKPVVSAGLAVMSLATDDYLEVPDSAALNFAAGEEFTVCALIRRFGAPGSSQVVAAKKANLTTAAGWSLHVDTSRQVVARIGDGTTNISANTAAMTDGALSFVALVRRGGQLFAHLNGTTSAGTADTVGSSVNAEVLRAGRLSGAGTNYVDGEIFALAVFRSGLTDSQLARVRAEMERN